MLGQAIEELAQEYQEWKKTIQMTFSKNHDISIDICKTCT
jgi:hypothetical protein